MKKLLSLCAIFVSFGSSVQAQQADPVAALPICTLEGTRANCTSLGSSFNMPGGLSGFLPVDNLATAQDVASLNVQTNLISAGVAMSGALDFQSPQDGRDNRLGGGVATFNDQTALGVTYTRRAGSVDVNFGIATSAYQNFAKASVGFSW